MSDLLQTIERAIADGILTTDEHEEMMTMIHKDGQIDAEEKAALSRIFQLIQSGQLKVVDHEREASYERRREEVKNKLSEQQLEIHAQQQAQAATEGEG